MKNKNLSNKSNSLNQDKNKNKLLPSSFPFAMEPAMTLSSLKSNKKPWKELKFSSTPAPQAQFTTSLME